MRPERNADARTRSDEAVRRLREESAQRVARERRWRGFTSWCALASLAGGGGLFMLNAYDARARAELATVQEARQQERSKAEEAAVEAKERAARVAVACAKRAAALEAIEAIASEAGRRARSSDERTNIRVDAAVHALAVIDDAAAAGCEEPVPLHDDL